MVTQLKILILLSGKLMMNNSEKMKFIQEIQLEMVKDQTTKRCFTYLYIYLTAVLHSPLDVPINDNGQFQKWKVDYSI